MTTQLAEPDTANAEVTAGTNSLFPGIVVTLEAIDLRTAQEWKLLNTLNRKVKKRHEAAILRDLLNKLWVIDGSAICFDVNGDLVDGQHRLNAIIAYYLEMRHRGEIPVPQGSVVVRGLPVEARHVKDTNATRSPGDAAAIAEYANSFLLAALARQVIVWSTTTEALGGKGSTKATNQEVLAAIEAHPEFHDIVKETNTMSKRYGKSVPGLTAGIAEFALWLFSYRDAETGRAFMEQVWTGANLDAGSPIMTFRDRLVSAKTSNEKLTSLDVLMFLLTAWNAFQEAKSIRRLQRPRGTKGEGTGHFTTANLREMVVHHAPPRQGDDAMTVPHSAAENALLPAFSG